MYNWGEVSISAFTCSLRAFFKWLALHATSTNVRCHLNWSNSNWGKPFLNRKIRFKKALKEKRKSRTKIGFVVRKIGNICVVCYVRKTIWCGYKKWCRLFGWSICWKPYMTFFCLKVQYLQKECVCFRIGIQTQRVVDFFSLSPREEWLSCYLVVLRIATWTECKLMNIKMIAIERKRKKTLWCQYTVNDEQQKRMPMEWHNESRFATNKCEKVSTDQCKRRLNELRRERIHKISIKHSERAQSPRTWIKEINIFTNYSYTRTKMQST